jgi:MFS transporter, SP family, general alpha glucoside:H+ symporter
MAGVFASWFLMTLGIGRRSLYLYGLCGLCTMLIVIGFLGLPEDRDAASLATGSMLLIWAAVYQCTVGTVCFSLVAELSTRRLQIKTVALGRAAYNVIAIINNFLTPLSGYLSTFRTLANQWKRYMLNPSAWNWGNYAGYAMVGPSSELCQSTNRCLLPKVLLGWRCSSIYRLHVLQNVCHPFDVPPYKDTY